ncbi:hypothetical protein DRF65_22845 [Chryseobacterium pennae]|uniref:DUF4268 domain-containing protein n=1 Tax=Chryseobacterium pennae TaxID=2258962 RepID=A0A3D9C3G5_9FLAO|nr:hypothetical protein [Chryseobacterium pennae]REC60031.1 hypothetical protein DRF65_22845 [Chryseobacterium pennae]
MDYEFYLNKFHLAITEVLKEKLENNKLDVSVDTVLDSVALKVFKPEWSSDLNSPLDAIGRIFFSIWINDKTIQEGRMYYNIHALKLREFKKQALSSRKFAQDFRNEFRKYQKDWPNVNIEFGPLTLMQGWVDLKEDNIQGNIEELVQNFFKISSIIDTVLERYKK